MGSPCGTEPFSLTCGCLTTSRKLESKLNGIVGHKVGELRIGFWCGKKAYMFCVRSVLVLKKTANLISGVAGS